MEQNQDQSLFGLNIDTQSKGFLYETARWAKFLAILGIISCAILAFAGIVTAANGSEMERAMSRYGSSVESKGMVMGMAIAYILFAALYFFPCLYLLRFSNHMKAALATDDQLNLTTAFQNLKSTFKFIGVSTIIVLAIYVLALIVGVGASV